MLRFVDFSPFRLMQEQRDNVSSYGRWFNPAEKDFVVSPKLKHLRRWKKHGWLSAIFRRNSRAYIIFCRPKANKPGRSSTTLHTAHRELGLVKLYDRDMRQSNNSLYLGRCTIVRIHVAFLKGKHYLDLCVGVFYDCADHRGQPACGHGGNISNLLKKTWAQRSGPAHRSQGESASAINMLARLLLLHVNCTAAVCCMNNAVGDRDICIVVLLVLFVVMLCLLCIVLSLINAALLYHFVNFDLNITTYLNFHVFFPHFFYNPVRMSF